MKNLKKVPTALVVTFYLLLSTFNSSAQNVGINTTGATPDGSALLDLDAAPGNDKGLLVPRLTTTERDAIVSPANSLLIFNTTTRCYEGYDTPSTTWVAFGCIGCTVPTGVTASAAPNPICVGSTLTLTGGATDATSWAWTGPNSFTSTSQSPTIASITTSGAGIYTLTASNACGAAPAVNTASVTVNAPLSAGTLSGNQNICDGSTTTFSSTQSGGSWSSSNTGTATVNGSGDVTGQSAGTATITYTVDGTGGCSDATATRTVTTESCPCGSATNLTDTRDSKTYGIVEIGNQCWMSENLAYLPSVVGPGTGNGTNPYYYVYGYNGTDVTTAKSGGNYSTYGVLYNWPAIMDGAGSSSTNPSGVQGVCPTGWHLPSDEEWKELEMQLGMSPVDADATGWRGTNEGDQLKTSSWGGTNSSGFTALPGGYRNANGSFYGEGSGDHWWSATESGAGAWRRSLYSSRSDVYRDTRDKGFGFSVRCIRN